MSETKNNDCIDAMKAVLAIFIIIIHVGLGITKYIVPILRAAVPLFFVTSSYFFFAKITYKKENDLPRIKKFIKRDLLLYAFWFIALFPITLMIRNYFSKSILYGIARIVKGVLLDSTFRASWFLTALIEGVLIIYVLGRYLSDKIIFILTFLIYVLCCLTTNYGLLPPGNLILTLFETLHIKIYQSVFVALFWIEVGKIIAKNFEKIKSILVKNNHRFFSFLALSIILLYIERGLTLKLQCSRATDCYFTLLPFVILIFVKVISMDYSLKGAKFMRNFSTVSFCTHFSLTTVYKNIALDIFNNDIIWLRFIITLLSCIVLTEILMRLSKCKHLGWLKYSY